MLLGVKPDSEAARSLLEVDLAAQTARLSVDGTPAAPVPISSGRPSFPTPRGEFVITDKHRKWRSTIYPADMPFFMRLSCGDFGLHAGYLPGYPASHGCIRLNQEDAENFFKTVPIGTRVLIK
ncbi:MAG: L,D-transpeptidase [Chthoniobacterales bacterium]|nr:L,D-transpeptidase [Chthoniobacterales bacterium]